MKTVRVYEISNGDRFDTVEEANKAQAMVHFKTDIEEMIHHGSLSYENDRDDVLNFILENKEELHEILNNLALKS